MPGRIAKVHVAVLSAIALLAHQGCLTEAVLFHAEDPHLSYAQFTKILRAVSTEDSLFVKVAVKRPGKTRAQQYVLRVPLDDPNWLLRRNGQPIVADDYVWDRVSMEHIPAWFLKPARSLPSGAKEITIERVQTDDLRRLPDLSQPLPQGVRVLSVKYTPAPGTVSPHIKGLGYMIPPQDPLLVIYAPRENADICKRLIVADFYERPRHDRGWYAVTPLSLAADLATLPLQLIVAILLAGD